MAARHMFRKVFSHQLRLSSVHVINNSLTGVCVARRQLSTTLPALGQLYFTKDHEYLDVTGNTAKLGITNHAQKELGDVVYVDLPTDSIGEEIDAGDVACSVESVKAVAEVFMPITGKLVSVNEALNSTPDLVNSSPESEGWLVEVEVAEQGQLKDMMDESTYSKYLEETD